MENIITLIKLLPEPKRTETLRKVQRLITQKKSRELIQLVNSLVDDKVANEHNITEEIIYKAREEIAKELKELATIDQLKVLRREIDEELETTRQKIPESSAKLRKRIANVHRSLLKKVDKQELIVEKSVENANKQIKSVEAQINSKVNKSLTSIGLKAENAAKKAAKTLTKQDLPKKVEVVAGENVQVDKEELKTKIKYKVTAVDQNGKVILHGGLGKASADKYYVNHGADGEGTEDLDYLQLNTNYTATGSEPIGRAYWNPTDKTWDVRLTADVTGQMFQETFFDGINQTGSDIADGIPIMFAGPIGASGKVEIQPANADGTLLPSWTMGIATEAIPDGEEGKVTWFGKVRGINTSGSLTIVNAGSFTVGITYKIVTAGTTDFTLIGAANNNVGTQFVATGVGSGSGTASEVWEDGDIIYVGITAGALTKVAPEAPYRRIEIATVIKAHAIIGTLLVRPSWRSKVTELDDVDGTPLTVNGQIMVWDNDNQYFDMDYNIDDYLRADGTIPLTANWDAGSFQIRAETFQSDVATGTAPFTVASTTVVTNLNADLLDGQEGSYYLDSANFTGTNWTDLTDGGDTTLHDHDGITEAVAHITATGASHSYIDQNVTTTGDPTFNTARVGGLLLKESPGDYYLSVFNLGDLTADRGLFINVNDTARTITLSGNPTLADWFNQTVKTTASPTFVTAKLTALTNGYLPYHVSDAVGLANSPIYTDGTNVGIGTTAPDEKLEIVGNILLDTEDPIISDGGSYRIGLRWFTSANDFAISRTANGGSLWTDRFFVDGENGNVGIGTTSPDRELHVWDSDSGASGYSLTGGIDIDSNAISGINILSPNAGSGRIYFGAPISNTAGAVEYIHNATLADSYMKLRAGDVDTLFLKNGNVGIGTTSPELKLHVQSGGVKISRDTVSDTILSYGDQTGLGTITGLSDSDWFMTGGLNNSFVVGTQGNSSGEGFEVGILSGTTFTPQFLVESTTGNVGIGTSGPTFKLQVTGTGASGSVGFPTTYGETVGNTNRDLYIDNTGKLGYVSSSIRYKKNVVDIVDSSWIYDLRPVEFDYIENGAHRYGLIAEEVELVNPFLISYNNDNLPETVSYNHLITPMLKEIQELKKEINLLKSS